MTANHTPKLNLMSPVDSDTFTSSDFADTFTKLDNAPGISLVANYTALLALGWTTNQHGRQVLQLDNGALWYWYDPSGSGSWKRSNSVGLLKRAVQTSDVTSTATSGTGTVAVQTGNITVPGGRALHVSANMGLDNSISVDGLVEIRLLDNGSTLKTMIFRAGKHYWGSGNNCNFDWYIENPTPNSTHNFAISVRAAVGSAASGAGGTAACRASVLTVVEV